MSKTFMADFLSGLFTLKKWHVTNCYSRNPECACAVSSIWNIAVVRQLLRSTMAPLLHLLHFNTHCMFYFPQKACRFHNFILFGGEVQIILKCFINHAGKLKYLPHCLKVDRPTPLRFVYIVDMTSKRRNLAAAEDRTVIQPTSSHFADWTRQ